MAYKSRLSTAVVRQIARWGLSDFVWTEVYLRLRETLPADPLGQLRRQRRPFEGMTYSFAMIDPENREHYFLFLVRYLPDEETLLIVSGGYERRVGL